MATLQEKIRCERAAREMIREGGLPDPDRIEYGHTCIRLFWEETKVVLVVDIDDPPVGLDLGDESMEDLDDDGLLYDEEPDPLEYEDAAELLRGMDEDDQEEAA